MWVFNAFYLGLHAYFVLIVLVSGLELVCVYLFNSNDVQHIVHWEWRAHLHQCKVLAEVCKMSETLLTSSKRQIINYYVIWSHWKLHIYALLSIMKSVLLSHNQDKLNQISNTVSKVLNTISYITLYEIYFSWWEIGTSPPTEFWLPPTSTEDYVHLSNLSINKPYRSCTTVLISHILQASKNMESNQFLKDGHKAIVFCVSFWFFLLVNYSSMTWLHIVTVKYKVCAKTDQNCLIPWQSAHRVHLVSLFDNKLVSIPFL